MDNYGFSDENPHITWNPVVAPFAEIHDKMLAACASGVGVPDVMRLEQGRMAAFFKGDEICFIDMTDRIGDRLDDLVLGSAVDYWSWKGSIYGIGNGQRLFPGYRKSVFDEMHRNPVRKLENGSGVVLKEANGMAAISWQILIEIMLFAAR